MREKVLIVEQDPRVAAVYRGLVTDAGLESVVARDGLEALSLLKRHGAPRAIVTALSLAGADGFVVLRELRRLPGGDRTAAVVSSAFADLRSKALALKDELKLSAVVAKDAPASTLLKALRKALAGATSTDAAPPAETTPPPPAAPRTTIDARLQEAREASERRRLEAIDSLGLLPDRSEDDALQRLVHDVAKAFGVPISLVTLVLEDRQFFKAHTGLTGALLRDRGTPRSWSFCSHVVEGGQPLVVPDAAISPVFKDNPLVRDGTLRSYAGVPLQTPSGTVLGSLCIIDTKPMAIRADQVDALGMLARRVAGELEARALPARASSVPAPALAPDLYRTLLDHLEHGVMLLGLDRRIVWANAAMSELFDAPPGGFAGMTRDDFLARQANRFDDPEVFLRVMRIASDGPWAGRLELELQRPVARRLRWVARPIRVGNELLQLAVWSELGAS